MKDGIIKFIAKAVAGTESLLNVSPEALVLCYHRISDDGTIVDVKIKNFISQIEYLKNNFKIVDLEKIISYVKGEKKLDRKSVCVTFDDGYKDLIANALPVLKKYGIKPALFVITDPENANRKELENKHEIITGNELGILINEGWTIGSHTRRHSNLLNIDTDEAQNEIYGSKLFLENNYGIRVKYIAYPKGFYNRKIIDTVRKAGYDSAFNYNDYERIRFRKNNLYTISRIGIDRTHDAVFPLLLTNLGRIYLKYKFLFKNHGKLWRKANPYHWYSYLLRRSSFSQSRGKPENFDRSRSISSNSKR